MPKGEPVAIVTGGASGLGAACAHTLAAEGYRVGLLDRDGDALRKTADDLVRDGAHVDIAECDLLDETSVPEAITSLAAAGELKTLANVAGVTMLGKITDIDVADWERVVDIKLRGDFLTCRAAIPIMVANGGGAVVNVSSSSGRTKAFRTAPNYVAANAGVIGLTMTLAAQHAAEGVRINCVAPGFMQTPMVKAYTDEQFETLKKGIPLGRVADPSEVASVVSFLASEKASYITGETVNVNGGIFMV